MNFETKIFEALGEASMCWIKNEPSILDTDKTIFNSVERNKYIFDSTLATTIGNKLVNDIKSDIFEMLTWASKNNYESIHGGRWAKKYMSITISSEELFNKWLEENKENEN
jgi:hypothetical protein